MSGQLAGTRLPAFMPWGIVGLVTLAFAAVCVRFVWQPTLATFADDSVSYLVMAQVFSPWQAASPAVTEAFSREAFYPPLFPLLLALAGAAHDTAWAHALTALLLAGSIPLVFALGARWLEDRRAAAAVAVCVVLLPSLWVNAKGILSEPLFCLLLLATLYVVDRSGKDKDRIVLLGLLMAAMALTRTAALPMIAAYGLWAATRRGASFASNARAAIPALAALGVYAAWVLLRPASTTDNYARIVFDHAGALLAAQSPLTAIGAGLLKQANAVAEGWIGSLILYWIEGRPVRAALAGLVGGLALAGMGLRIAAGKADGWMLAAYLATFLVWPFYDQMGRFLFPALPVLILHAFLAVAWAARALQRPQALGTGILVLLLLSLTLPPMAFIYQRAQAQRYAGIVDWYRTPGLAEARARAQVHLDLFADMAEIGRLARSEERVMWIAPSYIALLAGRHGLAAPDSALSPEAYREAVRASGADFVFLSLYHPRDTLRTAAWQAGTRALTAHARAVHVRAKDGGSELTSILLKTGK